MSSNSNKPDRDHAARNKDARLAEALRANLHRRKQQARARAGDDTPTPAPEQPGSESEA